MRDMLRVKSRKCESYNERQRTGLYNKKLLKLRVSGLIQILRHYISMFRWFHLPPWLKWHVGGKRPVIKNGALDRSIPRPKSTR
jgi:hypothetical protein